MELDQLKARAKDSLEKHGGVDAAAFEKMSPAALCRWGLQRSDHVAELRKRSAMPKRRCTIWRFRRVCSGRLRRIWRRSDAQRTRAWWWRSRSGAISSQRRSWARRCIEYFPEEDIFRIDHYLGKEPVQNILYTRFANPMFEPIWNRDHVRSIQITMAEDFGVEDRGKFYDEVGALLDVVQNHMLQVVAT